ncbi:hypothetical protein MUDAN_BIHEEGNE_03529 [Lactiplantibacillus mudanjiangensis]|nr:hypothetical protein MUDAN_BIHEEGNE_03529 [Lactiplantibacillus mudanjiangensis]
MKLSLQIIIGTVAKELGTIAFFNIQLKDKVIYKLAIVITP